MNESESNRVIGIDLLTNDCDGGVYGLCESLDGGETWIVIESGRSIEGLLEFAKVLYEKNTPMVMHQQIRELARWEIAGERELQHFKYLKMREQQEKQSPRINPQSWLGRLIKYIWG